MWEWRLKRDGKDVRKQKMIEEERGDGRKRKINFTNLKLLSELVLVVLGIRSCNVVNACSSGETLLNTSCVPGTQVKFKDSKLNQT